MGVLFLTCITFFSLTFFWVFPPFAFPAVLNRFRAGVDMGRREKDTKFFLHTFENHYFFCRAFYGKTMGHLFNLVFVLIVHGIEVPWSNFIQNPFCYFGNSTSVLESLINPIICASVQNCSSNSFRCMQNL